jgi:hypothetical protein
MPGGRDIPLARVIGNGCCPSLKQQLTLGVDNPNMGGFVPQIDFMQFGFIYNFTSWFTIFI